MTRDDVDTARAAASVSADDPPAEITTTSVSSAIGVTRAMDELSAVAAIPCERIRRAATSAAYAR